MALRIAPQAEPLPGYVLVQRLGSGGFGEVWKVIAPGGIAKAIKIIHGSLHCEHDASFALQELKALSRVKAVRHPYLLALDRFDIVDGRLLIVMELADCNLWERFLRCREAGLPGIPRHELLTYMLETAEVLDLFNDQFQLQHLDIKPQNLFLLHNHIKVADFGQVKDLQGLVASVTGGITPVYAAPETFDGVITRYCDQYSLACVYQELLTGKRPFDGTTPAQLLRQHLFQAPQLDPLPPSDRAAVARALAKKPEDRWPTVTAFVQHLIGSTPSGVIRFPALRRTIVPSAPAQVPELPATPVCQDGETLPGGTATAEPHLPPTLVIGLGGSALPIMQRLRWEWLQMAQDPNQQYRSPPLELLFIDTDAATLEQARQDVPAEGRAALPEEALIHTPLQRMAYYMRPRPSGRLVTEGWFDQTLLHALPRQPQTEGIRMLGRLAFCDYHRLILQRLESALRSLSSFVANASPLATSTNPPSTVKLLVFVIAGSAGGTGSGMFVDVAYAVRTRLQQLDIPKASIQAVLLLPPPPSPTTISPVQTQVNTYAALLELAYYSRPDTLYTVDYEELHGRIQTRIAPFDRCWVVLQEPSNSEESSPRRDSTVLRWRSWREGNTGSRSTTRPAVRDLALTPAPTMGCSPSRLSGAHVTAAELLRILVLTPVGTRLRTAHAQRPSPEPAAQTPLCYATFSLQRWPRRELLHRLALMWARQCVYHWTNLPAHEPSQQLMALAHQLWAELKLTPAQLKEELEQALIAALGRSAAEIWQELVAPHLPRSWFGRLPQGNRLEETVEQLLLLLGPPRQANTSIVGVIEQHLYTTIENHLHQVRKQLPRCLENWIHDRRLYLGGCEVLLWQWHAVAERFWNRYALEAESHAQKAQGHYDVLMQAVHTNRGLRRPNSTELRDALRGYPETQYATLHHRALSRFYQQLRDILRGHLEELRRCREQFRIVVEEQTTLPMAQERLTALWLLPPDCSGLEEIAARVSNAIPERDQEQIRTAAFAALHSPDEGPLLSLLVDDRGRRECSRRLIQALAHLLPSYLEHFGFFQVLRQHFPQPHDLPQALRKMLAQLEPPLLLTDGSSTELLLFACPPGPLGSTLRELAMELLPPDGLLLADLEDEWLLYREWSGLPWETLPHCTAEAMQAYRLWQEQCETSPHSRIDVTDWQSF
ncbi:MAG: protein kinase [Gemmataceae bacterium]|nr:protein kinase [Gemmataceae bacterium]MDW8244815.1 tubulin-like doman-containing protein [Thermogemmata sp.]